MLVGVIDRLSKGVILPVKVHLEKPKQVQLDWDQMEEQVINEGEEKARRTG